VSNFDENILLGRTIENAVKDALKQRYSVMMVSNIETDGRYGPQMESSTGGVTLADLQLHGGVRRGWVEVKYKSKAQWFRNWQRAEHGIDLQKWNQYMQLQAETEMPVYLMICQLDTKEILMQSCNTLQGSKDERVYNGSNHPSMINWPISMFAKVGRMSIPLMDIRRVSIEIDWWIFEQFVTQPLLYEERAL
jgi:hypothetical protein